MEEPAVKQIQTFILQDRNSTLVHIFQVKTVPLQQSGQKIFEERHFCT